MFVSNTYGRPMGNAFVYPTRTTYSTPLIFGKNEEKSKRGAILAAGGTLGFLCTVLGGAGLTYHVVSDHFESRPAASITQPVDEKDYKKAVEQTAWTLIGLGIILQTMGGIEISALKNKIPLMTSGQLLSIVAGCLLPITQAEEVLILQQIGFALGLMGQSWHFKNQHNMLDRRQWDPHNFLQLLSKENIQNTLGTVASGKMTQDVFKFIHQVIAKDPKARAIMTELHQESAEMVSHMKNNMSYAASKEPWKEMKTGIRGEGEERQKQIMGPMAAIGSQFMWAAGAAHLFNILVAERFVPGMSTNLTIFSQTTALAASMSGMLPLYLEGIINRKDVDGKLKISASPFVMLHRAFAPTAAGNTLALVQGVGSIGEALWYSSAVLYGKKFAARNDYFNGLLEESHQNRSLTAEEVQKRLDSPEASSLEAKFLPKLKTQGLKEVRETLEEAQIRFKNEKIPLYAFLVEKKLKREMEEMVQALYPGKFATAASKRLSKEQVHELIKDATSGSFVLQSDKNPSRDRDTSHAMKQLMTDIIKTRQIMLESQLKDAREYVLKAPDPGTQRWISLYSAEKAFNRTYSTVESFLTKYGFMRTKMKEELPPVIRKQHQDKIKAFLKLGVDILNTWIRKLESASVADPEDKTELQAQIERFKRDRDDCIYLYKRIFMRYGQDVSYAHNVVRLFKHHKTLPILENRLQYAQKLTVQNVNFTDRDNGSEEMAPDITLDIRRALSAADIYRKHDIEISDEDLTLLDAISKTGLQLLGTWINLYMQHMKQDKDSRSNEGMRRKLRIGKGDWLGFTEQYLALFPPANNPVAQALALQGVPVMYAQYEAARTFELTKESEKLARVGIDEAASALEKLLTQYQKLLVSQTINLGSPEANELRHMIQLGFDTVEKWIQKLRTTEHSEEANQLQQQKNDFQKHYDAIHNSTDFLLAA